MSENKKRSFATPYDGLSDMRSHLSSPSRGDPDTCLVQQHHKVDADVLNIIDYHHKTGLPIEERPGVFEDVSDFASFSDALSFVDHACDRFEALPAKLKSKFNFDPVLFFNFISDPLNANKLIDYDLVDESAKVVEDPLSKSDPSDEPSDG